MRRLSAILIVALACIGFVLPVMATDGGNVKLPICHAGSEQNPNWVLISPDSNSYRGHLNHDNDFFVTEDSPCPPSTNGSTTTTTVVDECDQDDECPPEETTTTTQPPREEQPTTTTAPQQQCPDGTIHQPPLCVVPTTVPPTTVPPVVVVPPGPNIEELPFTGIGTSLLGAVAVGTAALGATLLLRKVWWRDEDIDE